jgi:hypothetical protein
MPRRTLPKTGTRRVSPIHIYGKTKSPDGSRGFYISVVQNAYIGEYQLRDAKSCSVFVTRRDIYRAESYRGKQLLHLLARKNQFASHSSSMKGRGLSHPSEKALLALSRSDATIFFFKSFLDISLF